MKYRILHYGEPQLRQPTKTVTEINDDIRQLIRNMFETMYAANGCGLAANQVGFGERLAVIDLGEDPLVMINPRIIKSSGKESCEEGCLSFPGLREIVRRAKNVTLEAIDIEGNLYQLDARDLLARAIQHELDHLDGVVFVDRISKARKLQIKKQLQRIEAGEDLSRSASE